MRSILGLAALLALLLVFIGPEGGPSTSPVGVDNDCEQHDAPGGFVCLDGGRLLVSARGLEGGALSAKSASFHLPGEQSPALVVRVDDADPPAGASVGQGPQQGPTAGAGRWDRVFIASLTERELWVEVTDRELARTRVYHRPAGAGWGLVDTVPRRMPQRFAQWSPSD